MVSELLESREFLDPIKEYFIMQKQDLTNDIINHVSNLLTLIN